MSSSGDRVHVSLKHSVVTLSQQNHICVIVATVYKYDKGIAIQRVTKSHQMNLQLHSNALEGICFLSLQFNP